jgi:ribosomal protein S3AE
MTRVKEKMIQIIKEQPSSASFDEILKELAFARMIEKGLDDSENNRTISNTEMKRRILAWQK